MFHFINFIFKTNFEKKYVIGGKKYINTSEEVKTIDGEIYNKLELSSEKLNYTIGSSEATLSPIPGQENNIKYTFLAEVNAEWVKLSGDFTGWKDVSMQKINSFGGITQFSIDWEFAPGKEYQFKVFISFIVKYY